MQPDYNFDALLELVAAMVERANADANGVLTGALPAERLAEMRHARDWLRELHQDNLVLRQDQDGRR